MQVAGINRNGQFKKVMPSYGGQDINRRIRRKKASGVSVPGRLMDHMRRRTIPGQRQNRSFR